MQNKMKENADYRYMVFILGHMESTVWLKTLWFFTEDWAMYFAAVEETLQRKGS